MKTPSFLYFDLGKVLLDFSHREAARRMAEVAGVSEELVWKVVFQGDLEQRAESGQLTTEQVYEEFCEKTSSRPSLEAIERAGSDIFSINGSMVPVIAHLAANRYRLGILSNTSAAHWKYAASDRFGLIPAAFEVTTLSFEVGAMKPDPLIYQAAAENAGVDPADIFFMDDLEKNVEGALAAGFDAVLYRSTTELIGDLHARGIVLGL